MEVKSDSKTEAILIWVLLAVICVFHLVTLRSGHDWGGDFSQYIFHARNIADKGEFGNLNDLVIMEPYYRYSPETVPPVFPLLLSMPYKAFGLNLKAFKALIVIFWLMFLVLANQIFKKYLHQTSHFLFLMFLGLHPFFWDFMKNILTDIPFLFFTYATLYYFEKFINKEIFAERVILGSVILGMLMYVTYGTRSAGLVVVPVIAVYDIYFSKRITKRIVIATIVFLAFFMPHSMILPRDTVIITNFNLNNSIYTGKIIKYLKAVRNFYIGNLMFTVYIAMFLYGWVKSKNNRLSIYKIFLFLYCIMIFLWSGYQGFRYLIPIAPLLYFFPMVAFDHMLEKRSPRLNAIAVLVVLATFISFSSRYVKVIGKHEVNIESSYAQGMFNYISEHTPEDARIIFSKPRVLSLFTGRRCSKFYPSDDEQYQEKYIKDIAAQYIVTLPLEREYERKLKEYIINNKDRLKLKYKNEEHSIYEIEKH